METISETFAAAAECTQGAAGGRSVSPVPRAEPGIAGGQRKDLSRSACRGVAERAGKKTVEAIQQEAAREVAALLEVIFKGLHKSGQFDLEAVEMATRAACHQLGAKLLEGLLSRHAGLERTMACNCGEQARFHQMRVKQMMTVLGPIHNLNGPITCARIATRAAALDRELDMEGVACSPGVRRMMAVVGSESSFEQSREQLQLWAGIEVPTKTVERHAEAIGADIERVNSARSSAANNWNYRRLAPQPCRCSTSRWTAPAFRW